MADIAEPESAELAAWRKEIRAWLEANAPKSIRGRGMTMEEAEMGVKPTEDAELFKKRMAEKGYGTPTWPKKYGGAELSQAQARVLQQEMARIGVTNPMAGMGSGMFGHTLLEYGNEEQKMLHLNRISKGEVRWCQGYSEPGAGSDLASLQTRAVDMGDHFLVNGQKIWTSGAHMSDWIFCLVRTDTTKKHEGISFLLIDMHSPGVEARPILMISGASGQCQTFFTDVKVPKENLVGEINKGWTIAKRLLQFERSGQGGLRGAPGVSISDMAKNYVGTDEKGRLADTDLRSRLSSYMISAKAHQLTMQRAVIESRGQNNPSAATSVMKNSGTQLGQLAAELTLELMGNRGRGWEGEGFTKEELQAVRGWLGGKASTIYGGSQEVQNNIISKRILGLPDPSSGASH